MSRKHIHLNAFNMNSVGHIHHGMWTHPRDQSHRYNTLEYWIDQARLLERGLYRTAYTPGSLRHKLYGHVDRLPELHAGAKSRHAAAAAQAQ